MPYFIVRGIDPAGHEYRPRIVEAETAEEAAVEDVQSLGDATYRVAVYELANRREFTIVKSTTIKES